MNDPPVRACQEGFFPGVIICMAAVRFLGNGLTDHLHRF
jgi:hypothetical protein